MSAGERSTIPLTTRSILIINIVDYFINYRLDLAVMFVHYLWVGPVETIVVTYFMYQEIGISAIFGTLFLLAFIPFQCTYKGSCY